MKKQLILLIIITSITAFFLIKPNKKDNKKISNNSFITILLENEKGNTKVNEFPSKENYTYDKIKCNNIDKETSFIPVFNEENWKLNINLNSLNKMDGNFNCEIYFKEKETAAKVLITKYNKNNKEGLIKIEQPETTQTKETTEYRYSGSNDVVKNYVNFNNETWRIIGIFDVDDGTGKIEKRIKIVREDSIGSYSWDSSSSSINGGYGSNQWGPTGSYPGADLMQELNDTYYNSKNGTCYNGQNNLSTACNFETIGLNENSRKMISNAKWYLGASTLSATFSDSYIKERSNTIGIVDNGQSITKTNNWIGKIGLIYPSDYGYATSGGNESYLKTCYEQNLYTWNNYPDCYNNDWLLYTITTWQWTLSPREAYNARALFVNSAGYVSSNDTYFAYAIRPVVYLSSHVQITKGTGTSNTPYEFSL